MRRLGARLKWGCVLHDVGRTSFEEQQRARPRERRLRLPADWREWLLPTLNRAIAAIGFVVLPRVEERMGDPALAAVCIGAGGTAIALTILVWYTTAMIRRELVADAVTALVLVPATSLASGIELADARFGGRSLNFLAATLAILAIFLITATIGSLGGSARGPLAQASVLPGALVIAACIGGASRFSSGTFWQGVSLAWMAAAALTLLIAFLPQARRTLIPTLGYAVFAIVMLYLGLASGSGESIEGAVAALAAAATALPGFMMILLGQGPRARAMPPFEPPDEPEQPSPRDPEGAPPLSRSTGEGE